MARSVHVVVLGAELGACIVQRRFLLPLLNVERLHRLPLHSLVGVVDLQGGSSQALFFELVGEDAAVVLDRLGYVRVILSDVLLHRAEESLVLNAASMRRHVLLV